ncbi:kinase-like protein [Mytilinidion resinicola]|uniref:non-specific serine/threonine protein kinase n=1 Tax=Mytilinidion resinicola TaxID=574789 RepID=A0A6A6YRA9_9PEZI|nr:kinase-like protein [Mytilinidion resinicola]KAF2811462.1 kinase-like protein [Mytilinidion resinicola]
MTTTNDTSDQWTIISDASERWVRIEDTSDQWTNSEDASDGVTSFEDIFDKDSDPKDTLKSSEVDAEAWVLKSSEKITFKEDTLTTNWVYREITRGGQGAINLIQHKKSHRHYIMKQMFHDVDEETKHEIEMFEAARGHPRILSYLGNLPNPSEPLKLRPVFEYCRESDLSEYYNTWQEHEMRMPETLLWHIFEQLAEGLVHLHKKRNIVHRDIKPANILIASTTTGGYPEIKFADFGLAQFQSEELDKEEYGAGTWSYQPPEPFRSTKASDIWAVGSIIHYLALGVPPCSLGRLDTDMPIEEKKEKKKLALRQPKHICKGASHLNYSDKICQAMKSACHFNAQDRPSASQLLQLVRPFAPTRGEMAASPLLEWAIQRKVPGHHEFNSWELTPDANTEDDPFT